MKIMKMFCWIGYHDYRVKYDQHANWRIYKECSCGKVEDGYVPYDKRLRKGQK